MHPPHPSIFINHDGNGKPDEGKVLVKNIAFTFKDRSADHTSIGVTPGVDGWLYLAIGDFGFKEAEGLDDRKVQLRGGGVASVRPDGSGLEITSRGTRNILEVALDPGAPDRPRPDGCRRRETHGETLKLDAKPKAGQPDGPEIETLTPETVIAAVAKSTGNREFGEQLFTRLNCADCHTVTIDEPLRGPFLGTVAATCKVQELAEAVLFPSQSDAPGLPRTCSP